MKIQNKNIKCKSCSFRHQCREGVPPPIGPCSLGDDRDRILRRISREVDRQKGKILFLERPVTVDVDDWTGERKHTVTDISFIPATVDNMTVLHFGDGITGRDLSTKDLNTIIKAIGI